MYQYAQAVYLLPVRRARGPRGDERLPGAGRPHRVPVRTPPPRSRGRCVPCSCSPALSVGVLIAAAPAIGAFFSILDARGGDGAASTAALAACLGRSRRTPRGLVGFGLTALLTRALYVRGRPTDAGLAAALGWTVAALLPLLLVGTGQGRPPPSAGWGWPPPLGMTLSGLASSCSCAARGGRRDTRGAGRRRRGRSSSRWPSRSPSATS